MKEDAKNEEEEKQEEKEEKEEGRGGEGRRDANSFSSCNPHASRWKYYGTDTTHDGKRFDDGRRVSPSNETKILAT